MCFFLSTFQGITIQRRAQSSHNGQESTIGIGELALEIAADS